MLKVCIRNDAVIDAVIPCLCTALYGGSSKMRLWASNLLREIGPRSAPAVPALIYALQDRRWSVQASVARVLAQIGPPARSALPCLISALVDNHGGILPNVYEYLCSPRHAGMEWWRVKMVGNALSSFGPEVIPALMVALRDNSWS